MSRIRMILLSLFAVFAVSAVASASSSAATECGVVGAPLEEGGDIALCIGNPLKEVGSPTEHIEEPFTSKIKPSTVATLTVTGGPVIVCKKANDTGQVDIANGHIKDSINPEVSDLTITFSECEVSNASTKCAVTEPIVANGGGDGLDGTFINATDPTKGMSLLPSQQTGGKNLFVTIVIKHKPEKECLFETAGAEVTGSQELELPEVESGKVEHEVVAKASGSHLAYAGATATFTIQELVRLSSGEPWGFFKS
jgi:hypothetical protein